MKRKGIFCILGNDIKYSADSTIIHVRFLYLFENSSHTYEREQEKQEVSKRLNEIIVI